MNPAASSEFRISRNSRLWIESADRFTLRCTEGLLWITAEGFGGDIFLRKGMVLALHGAKNLLVSAERDSTIEIHAAATKLAVARGVIAAIAAVLTRAGAPGPGKPAGLCLRAD